MDVDQATTPAVNPIDQAIAAQAPAPAPTNEHLMNQALHSAYHGSNPADTSSTYGSITDRWDPLAAGSIERRDYYGLGATNISPSSTQEDKDYANYLHSIFNNVSEEQLIQRDVNPTGAESSAPVQASFQYPTLVTKTTRSDGRFQGGLAVAAAVLNPSLSVPVAPVQSGAMPNPTAATPATTPNAFVNQTPPTPAAVKPIKRAPAAWPVPPTPVS